MCGASTGHSYGYDYQLHHLRRSKQCCCTSLRQTLQTLRQLRNQARHLLSSGAISALTSLETSSFSLCLPLTFVCFSSLFGFVWALVCRSVCFPHTVHVHCGCSFFDGSAPVMAHHHHRSTRTSHQRQPDPLPPRYQGIPFVNPPCSALFAAGERVRVMLGF